MLEIDKSSKNHGGEAVIFKLKKTSTASPQPEWCVTQGGDKWDGKGPACLKTDKPKSMNQLRFKVKVQYKDTKEKFISVTTLLGKYKPPFDSDKHATRVAKREGVPRNDRISFIPSICSSNNCNGVRRSV